MTKKRKKHKKQTPLHAMPRKSSGPRVETCMLVKPALGGDPYEEFLKTLPELVPCTGRYDAMKGRPSPLTVQELGHLPEFKETEPLAMLPSIGLDAAIRRLREMVAEQRRLRRRIRRSFPKRWPLAKRALPLKEKKTP